MSDIQDLETELVAAHESGDKERAGKIAKILTLERQFATLPLQQRSVAQYKNNDLGDYLRKKASAPLEGETEQETGQRLYGEIPSSQSDDSVPMKTARNIFQGVTAGLGDEIVAGVTAGMDAATGEESFGDAYDIRVAQEREKVEDFRETNPYLAYGGEIAGAIPTFYFGGTQIARGGKALLEKLGPKVATKLDDLAKTNPSMLKRVLQAMGIGGVEGSIYAFNQGEGGVEERAKEGAKGGLLGAAIAPIAPVLGAGVKKGADQLQAFLASKKEGLSPTAFRLLSKVLLNDDTFEKGSKIELNKSAPVTPDQKDVSMLADTSPAASQLLDFAVERGGKGSRQARNRVTERAVQTGKELQKTLTEILTPPTTAIALKGKSIKQAIKDSYDAAYNSAIDYASKTGKELEQIVLNQVPQSALNQAAALMRLGKQKSQQYLFQFAEDGSVVGLRRMPDVRELDYITRALNDVAKQADGKGALGGTTNEGRLIKSLVGEIRNRMKNLVPAYKEALKLSGGKIRDKEAFDYGLTILRKGIPRKEAAQELAGMGEGEAKKVAAGMRESIDNELEKVELAMTDVNLDAREAYKAVKMLSSRQAKQKLADVMKAAYGPIKGGQLFRRFNKQFSRSLKALETRSSMAQNSKTFVRTKIGETVSDINQQGAVNQALSGNPLQTVKEIVRSVTGKTKVDLDNEVDVVINEIAEYLTKVRGVDAVNAVNRLRKIAPKIEEGAQQLGMDASRNARTTLAVGAQPLPLKYEPSELEAQP